MDSKKRVVVNTLAQHIRAILSLCMSLYSTRFVLQALGNSDFGIFSLVGSMVAMLGFITNAMVITTQRHLSFSHGKGNEGNLRQVFANSLFVHIIIGIVISVSLLLLEPFLFNGFLNIEYSRQETASYVYILMVLTLFITFVTSPFKALFIARENIVYISIIEFLDSALRLLLAILLLQIHSDRLIAYAYIITGITCFNFAAFAIYAKRNFAETQIIPKRKDINKTSIKEILGFAGWTIYSTGCIIGRTQGMAIVLNKFLGTIINTSYGIASQVSGAVQFIAQAVLNAMSPQIIKAEGGNNRTQMLMLSELTCKYAFLLLAMVVVPLAFEMPTILSLWLGDVPTETITFCRFILAASIIDQTTIGLGIANQAIGKIRNYSIIINTIKMMTLPFAWLCLKLDFPVVSTMWCYILMETICALMRLPFLKYTAGLSVSHFISHVFLRLLPPFLTLLSISWLLISAIQIPFRFLITIFVSICGGIVVTWITSFTPKEKDIALGMIKSIKSCNK